MPGSTDEIDRYLDRGEAWMALSIPPDYGRSVALGTADDAAVVADGTDSNSTSVAMGYAQTLIGGYAQDLAAARGARASPASRRWSRRRSASGSTRGSKAATS